MNQYKMIYKYGSDVEQIVIELEDIFTILYDSFKGYRFSYLTNGVINLEYIKQFMFEVEISGENIVMNIERIGTNKLYDLLQKSLLKSTFDSSSTKFRKDVINRCIEDFRNNEKYYYVE